MLLLDMVLGCYKPSGTVYLGHLLHVETCVHDDLKSSKQTSSPLASSGRCSQSLVSDVGIAGHSLDHSDCARDIRGRRFSSLSSAVVH